VFKKKMCEKSFALCSCVQNKSVFEEKEQVVRENFVKKKRLEGKDMLHQ